LGLGIGVSFKTGLFNIGAAGQFMLAGGVTTIMGILIHNIDRSLSIPLLILISAIIGAIAAGIAGVLKAFFNVHEVVTTILMN
jgi:simple sugar transport system permease protein